MGWAIAAIAAIAIAGRWLRWPKTTGSFFSLNHFLFSSQISQISDVDTGATQNSGTTAGGQQRLRGKLAGHRVRFLGVTTCDSRMGVFLPQIHRNRHSIWRYYQGIMRSYTLYKHVYIYIVYIYKHIYLHHYHVIPMLPMLPWKKTLSLYNRLALSHSGLGEFPHGSSWDGAEECGRTDRNWMIWLALKLCLRWNKIRGFLQEKKDVWGNFAKKGLARMDKSFWWSEIVTGLWFFFVPGFLEKPKGCEDVVVT